MGRRSLLRVSQLFPDDSANQPTVFAGLVPDGMVKQIWIAIRLRAGAVSLCMNSQLLQLWRQTVPPLTDGGGSYDLGENRGNQWLSLRWYCLSAVQKSCYTKESLQSCTFNSPPPVLIDCASVAWWRRDSSMGSSIPLLSVAKAHSC